MKHQDPDLALNFMSKLRRLGTRALPRDREVAEMSRGESRGKRENVGRVILTAEVAVQPL